MKNNIIKLLKFIGNFIIVLLFAIILYLALALIGTLIPSNIDSKQPIEGITIFIKSNGVHTDIVVPTENKFYNWNERILPEDFGVLQTEGTYTSFGWGDKGFYLNTPNWSDLKVSTALDAMLPYAGGSAMHVSIYEKELKENEKTKKIILTEEQYLILCSYILKTFSKSEADQFILIEGYHYNGATDNFYEAIGSYHLFNTCNTWANDALKVTGVKTAFWAPFDKCIFYHF